MGGGGGARARAGRLELPVKRFPTEARFENVGAEFAATVVILAHTDRAARPVRHLKGVTVNGTRVAEKMLTGSVLRVGGDGKGLYGYTAGFGVPVVPPIADPTRRTMDVEKNAWDPVDGASDGRYPWLLACAGGVSRRTTYELAFPEGIRIRKITAQAACEGPPEGVTVATQVSTDAAGRQVVAEKSFTNAGGDRYPHVFEGLDAGRLFLTLTGKGKATAILYNVTFWAELDCAALPRIPVRQGANTLSLGDDDDSSHLGRVFVEGFAKDALPKPAAPADPLAAYVSPNVGKKPARMVLVKDPREFFARGFYWGPGCPHWEFVLDDVKAHHMNCIYGSNWWPEALEKFLPLAEKAGVRVVYQGTSWGALYYFASQDEARRKAGYERDLVPSFQRLVPKVKESPALLMWSLTEEIPAGTAPYLSDYYRMVRQMDPNHPPTVLHNNVPAAKEDLATNKPLVVTTDVYPFFLDPRSGPCAPERSLAYYAGRFEELYRLCRAAGAAMWAMPQAWADDPDDSLDPPYFGPVGGMRRPTAAMMRAQAWIAVLKGATGVLYYAYIGSTGSHLRAPDWSETDQMRGASEAFADLEKVAGLLVRLERDYADQGFASSSDAAVWVHTFRSKPEYRLRARYAVLANTDWEKARILALTLQGDGAPGRQVVNCVTGKTLTQADLLAVTLPAGGGTVLAIGTRAEIEADRRAAKPVE